MASENEQELCVYGFIRRYYNLRRLPAELIQLCLSMYSVKRDAWDPDKTDIDIVFCDEDFNILQMDEDAWYQWRNAFGSLVIGKGDYQTWKIEIMGPVQRERVNRSIMFGIMSLDQFKLNKTIKSKVYFSGPKYNGYSFNAYDGRKCHKGISHKYGSEWYRGDIIEMTLDMSDENSKGKLSFKVNNIDQGVAFGVDKNKQYCMALAVHYVDKIRLFC